MQIWSGTSSRVHVTSDKNTFNVFLSLIKKVEMKSEFEKPYKRKDNCLGLLICCGDANKVISRGD